MHITMKEASLKEASLKRLYSMIPTICHSERGKTIGKIKNQCLPGVWPGEGE